MAKPDPRRSFQVSVTTATKGTTTHEVYAKDAAGVRSAARAFRRAWGHSLDEKATIVVGDPA